MMNIDIKVSDLWVDYPDMVRRRSGSLVGQKAYFQGALLSLFQGVYIIVGSYERILFKSGAKNERDQ